MRVVAQSSSSAALSSSAFSWDKLVKGRIIEVSVPLAGGGTTYAVDLLLHAQERGETTAWVQPRPGTLYPPDLSASGVDLAALIVVHTPPGAGPFGVPKAAEILLRSGAYGLVVLDMRQQRPAPAGAWLGRLLGLARQHASGVVLLTHKPSQHTSVGALASWRLEPYLQPRARGLFDVHLRVLKNKTSLCWPTAALTRRGPWGVW